MAALTFKALHAKRETGIQTTAPPIMGIREAKPYIIPKSNPLNPKKLAITPKRIPSKIAVTMME